MPSTAPSPSKRARRPALTGLLNDTRESGEPALYLIDLDKSPPPGSLGEKIAKRVRRSGAYEVFVCEASDLVEDLVGAEDEHAGEDEDGGEDEDHEELASELLEWLGSSAEQRNAYLRRLAQTPAPPPPSVIIHWVEQ
jgi:hypothetical protein